MKADDEPLPAVRFLTADEVAAQLKAPPIQDVLARLSEYYRANETRGSFLYFIRAGEDGPIKIGHAKLPDARRHALQPGNHVQLNVVCIFPGGVDAEVAAHFAFRHLRIRGEWFRPEPDLMALVTKLNQAMEKLGLS